MVRYRSIPTGSHVLCLVLGSMCMATLFMPGHDWIFLLPLGIVLVLIGSFAPLGETTSDTVANLEIQCRDQYQHAANLYRYIYQLRGDTSTSTGPTGPIEPKDSSSPAGPTPDKTCPTAGSVFYSPGGLNRADNQR